MNSVLFLIEKLRTNHRLSLEEYEELLRNRTEEAVSLLRTYADEERKRVYGNRVFIRGLIEISNICKNDCLYCGIRKSNRNCSRYRLSREEILSCCQEGYALGFRTFVLQGGENGYFTDEILVPIVKDIKRSFPDCAVTLSLGERNRESYELLFSAGADRYLLRHETADREHYEKLHPSDLSWEHRMKCLQDLKDIGFQTGCGFMVGSPFQTASHLAKDLKFIEEFSPDMCGIGPFIPHKDTPFGDSPPGDVDLTCYLLSILRLIDPCLLLPATTALGSLDPQGREKGILAGANVVMPNLSPTEVRNKYMLYNNKASEGAESAQCLSTLDVRLRKIGFEIVPHRGDKQKF